MRRHCFLFSKPPSGRPVYKYVKPKQRILSMTSDDTDYPGIILRSLSCCQLAVTTLWRFAVQKSTFSARSTSCTSSNDMCRNEQRTSNFKWYHGVFCRPLLFLPGSIVFHSNAKSNSPHGALLLPPCRLLFRSFGQTRATETGLKALGMGVFFLFSWDELGERTSRCFIVWFFPYAAGISF